MVQGLDKIATSGEGVQVRNESGSGSKTTDTAEAATAPKFGDLLNQIQAKYGQKPEKPREIKKTLGKDDFLKIMVTQMKNQDPTSPFKAEQMAAQMAQFTSVEQLQNVNQNLNKMAMQSKPLEQMSMAHLIGRWVTIDRDRFPHLEGESDPLSFYLPKDAQSVHLSILNDQGETLIEKDLGKKMMGENTFVWDGIKSNSLPAKSGNYIFRVSAKDGRDQPMNINAKVRGKVIGVSFENSEPVFLVGDAQHQDKVTMRNIVRVEMDQDQSQVAMKGGEK